MKIPPPTPEQTAQIVQWVKAGVYLEIAAASVKADMDTLHAWLSGRYRGKDAEAVRAFRSEVAGALAWAEAKMVSVVHAAATGAAPDTNWRAAAWMLQSKHPERWGTTNRKDARTDTTVRDTWSLDDPTTWTAEQRRRLLEDDIIPQGPPDDDVTIH